MKTLLLTLILITGCGRGIMKPEGLKGDFEGQFEVFEAASIIAGRDTTGDSGVSIVFGTPTAGADAECLGNERTVVVRKLSWDDLSPSSQEALILHELGHCILNLNHDSSRTSLGEPASLMYPSSSEVPYDGNEDHYQAELFTHARQ